MVMIFLGETDYKKIKLCLYIAFWFAAIKRVELSILSHTRHLYQAGIFIVSHFSPLLCVAAGDFVMKKKFQYTEYFQMLVARGKPRKLADNLTGKLISQTSCVTAPK